MGIADAVKGKADEGESPTRVMHAKAAAWAKKKGWVIAGSTAPIPMAGGKWRFYVKKPDEPKPVAVDVPNAEL